MPLPTIVVPSFTITLPLTKTKMELRPYLVKEDKILMMAATSQKPSDIAQATRQIINNCIITPKGLDCKTLPSVDVDFIFINLRARSVGEKIDLSLTCNHMLNDVPCGAEFEVPIRIDNIKLLDNDPTRQFEFTFKGTKTGVKMKYTLFNTTLQFEDQDDDTIKTYKALFNSIESIFDDNGVYKMKDTTYDEFVAWVENLTKEHYSEMIDFIEKYPTLQIETKHTCPKCKTEHSLKFGNVIDFF